MRVIEVSFCVFPSGKHPSLFSDKSLTKKKDTCCCNHGGRCTCSHKKEPPQLDPVPESDSDAEASGKTKTSSPKGVIRRRRANTTHSDGVLSFDENGHHKPSYKHAKTSQKCGPYQMSRVNSVPTSASMSNLRRESRGGTAARDPRQVRSETSSPPLSDSSSSLGQLGNGLTLDLSGIEYPAYVPNGFDLYSTVSEQDQGLFSAGLSATSVDWSHYDLDFSASRTAENFAPSSYSQTQSYGGYEFNGSEQAPTLTTTTSGDVSEVEEFMGAGLDDFDAGGAFGPGRPGRFDLSGAQPALLHRSSRLGPGHRLDFDELKFIKATGNKFLPTPTTSLPGDEPVMRPVPTTSGSAATAATATSFSFVEEDPAIWLGDYSHGLPAMTDSPVPYYLDTQ